MLQNSSSSKRILKGDEFQFQLQALRWSLEATPEMDTPRPTGGLRFLVEHSAFHGKSQPGLENGRLRCDEERVISFQRIQDLDWCVYMFFVYSILYM